MKTQGKFIVVSGLSGSGKSTAIKILEDLGFYCVDNLPTALLPKFVELSQGSGEGLLKVAMGVDIRERDFLKGFPRVLRALRREVPVELLFLESAKKVLARRFSETRRKHPLAMDLPLSEGIERESLALAPVRALADRIVDTSEMTVHDLKKMLTAMYRAPGESHRITLSLVSFGYRHGLPLDADIILDVRFLPNPHFIPGLRSLTGKNAKVRRFILSFSETAEFLAKTEDLLGFLLPRYIAEGKSYLLIGLGCTGGRHRSVAMVEELSRRLMARGYRAEITHRDLQQEAS